jgi:hypothetical protein
MLIFWYNLGGAGYPPILLAEWMGFQISTVFTNSCFEY